MPGFSFVKSHFSDTAACTVTQNGAAVPLTPKEYELLLLLLRSRGNVLYRDYLYDTIWGEQLLNDNTRTLDSHIRRLRKKLNWGDKIRTVQRTGYCLEKEDFR